MDSSIRVIPMLSDDWKIPLNLAIGVHVLILLGGLYLPGFFKAKPKFADIYTVSIINIAEPTASSPEPEVQSKQQSPPPQIVKPVKSKSVAPIAKPQPTPAPSPVKSISLKPLKKKKVKKVVKPPDQSRDRALERKRRQKLAQALREEELLAEKARLANEALEAERQLLKPQQAAAAKPIKPKGSTVGKASSASNTGTPGGGSNLIENQYLASIINRLHQHWALPEYLQHDTSLTAVVVITISRDGRIANMIFEQKAGNRVFNQFVSKTIEDANPLPPIPPAMKKQRYELGLRFKPGSIQ
ncbi:MAG: TonB C-terminal domain-containing protein [Desulforhopalus sp.]